MTLHHRLLVSVIVPVLLTATLMLYVQNNVLTKLTKIYDLQNVCSVLDLVQNHLSDEYAKNKNSNVPVGDLQELSKQVMQVQQSTGELYLLRNEIKQLSMLSGAVIPAVLVIVITVLSFLLVSGFLRPVALLTSVMLRYSEGDKGGFPLPVAGSREIRKLLLVINRVFDTVERQKRTIAHQGKFLGWRNAAREIVHEMKNRITPLKLASETILETAMDIDCHDMVNSAQRIHQTISSLERMTASLSELSSIRIPEMETVDLYEVASGCMNQNLPQFKNIRLSGSSAHVQGDRDLLESVLNNLIVNAIEAINGAPDGTIVLAVSAKPVPCIECIDNGSGIAPEILGSIMKLNFTTKKNGSGFGLYFAKKVMEDHGFGMAIESDPVHKTTCFKMVCDGQTDHC